MYQSVWTQVRIRSGVGIVIVIAAALSATIAGRGSEQATSPPEGWSATAAYYRQQVDQAGIAGSSLVMVRDGRTIADEQVGYQDLATKTPVDRDTIFHWASITKTFTSIAIMQLRDRGLLSLDDPVEKYVPEIRRVHNPYGPTSAITLRTLMSHSGGLRAGTWPWGGDQPWHPFEPTEWSQLVAMLPYTEILFPPGSRYRYSNPGILFLGRIIEDLSGDDYEVYINKNILMPLGMQRTFYDRAPYHLVSHRSHSYVVDDQGRREGRFDFDSGITTANGGLNAPLGDMARYLAFLLGDPARPEYEGVLKRSSLEEMWQPLLKAEDGEGGSGDDVRIGLSFFIERHHGVELVGHSGNQNGFLSHLYLHRPSRTGYIVGFNTDVSVKEKSKPSTRDVDDAVRDRIIRDVLSRPSSR
jgi:CubicO group peptidase (beta-lactamase class C family)